MNNRTEVLAAPPAPFSNTTWRLAALWAFSECALGGIMHAFKLPFTAVFVGGFAILCIGLLAFTGGYRPSVILRALVLVLAAKALVTPHSPPTAYLAVAFQGLSGALLLCYVQPRTLGAVLFGTIAMAESALQKILVLLLFFGKPLVEAVDLFVEDVLENFGLTPAVSAATAIAVAYVTGYTLWGIVLGRWIMRLPAQLEMRMDWYTGVQAGHEPTTEAAPNGRRPWRKLLGLAGILAFIVCVFLLFGGKVSGAQRAWYAVIRTTAVLLGWFFLLQPALQWAIGRWARRRAANDPGELTALLAEIPEWRLRVVPLYRAVSARFSGWRKWKELVLAFLVTGLTTPPPRER